MVFTIVAAVGADRFSVASGTGKLCIPACAIRRVWSSGGGEVCDRVGSTRRTDVIPSTCFEAKKKPVVRYVSPVGASRIRPGQLNKSSIV